MLLDTPTTNRYLRALDAMTRDQNLEHRAYARRMLADMGHKGVDVGDCLWAVMTLPTVRLSQPERRLRHLSEHSPHAGFKQTTLPAMRVEDGAVVFARPA